MTYSVGTSDIEARWRPLSDDEADIATTLIDDATYLIDLHRPSLAALIESGQISERVVTMTVVEACIRVLSNPDILANESITADGGVSIGWQFQQKVPAPRMRLSNLDFFNIDTAMEQLTGNSALTGSIAMKNATRWEYRRCGPYVPGQYLPFPMTPLDHMFVTDTYSIILT